LLVSPEADTIHGDERVGGLLTELMTRSIAERQENVQVLNTADSGEKRCVDIN